MKKLIITTIIALLTVAGITARAEKWPREYLGLPGDNLNLFAVMKLFQESETLESFERGLNDENSRINNLDLNRDNLVDYIMVFDYVDGNVHNIVLRVALNRYENQDIAVFTVQQFKNGQVEIQLIGDEALYGKNYIIEPVYAETPNPGYKGKVKVKPNVIVVNRMVYAVEAWPMIRFIYLPGYITWRSNWYWGYQPHYWNPWQPYYWHFYYGYHHNWHNYYYSHYRHWNHYRYARYNDFYYSGIRIYSPTIVVNIKQGNYKKTYSRPELRSNGSALYTMTNRANEKAAADKSVRRAGSSPVQTRSAETVNTANARRTATITDKRATSATEAVKSNETSVRRATVTNKPETTNSTRVAVRSNTSGNVTDNSKSSTGVTSRRTTQAINNKVSTTPAVRQNTVPVQKPSTTVTRRESAAPRTSTGTTVARPSVTPSKSAATGNSSVSRSTPTVRNSNERTNTSAGRTVRR